MKRLWDYFHANADTLTPEEHDDSLKRMTCLGEQHEKLRCEEARSRGQASRQRQLPRLLPRTSQRPAAVPPPSLVGPCCRGAPLCRVWDSQNQMVLEFHAAITSCERWLAEIRAVRWHAAAPAAAEEGRVPSAAAARC